MARTSKLEVERRIAEVAELLLSGVPRRTLGPALAARWRLGERQIDTYIARAREHLRAEGLVDRQLELGRAAGRLDVLYARAVQAQNWRLALQIVRTAAQLFGLNAATEIRHSGDPQRPLLFHDLSRLSDDDLAAAERLAGLLEEEDPAQ